MKAKIRGTKIYYDIAGMQLTPVGNDFVERSVIFLLHGGPGGDHLRFKQHSLELQDIAQLVFIDHRGCGRSKKTRQKDYTLENNIEDIEALRKLLGLDKIIILGASYGGIVAQGYAIRYPKRVEKLILCVTAPSYHTLEEAKKIIQKRGNSKQIAFCEHLWNGTFRSPAHVKKFFEVMGPIYSVRYKKINLTKPAKITTLFSHEALNEGFGGFLKTLNFVPRLKKISAPTLILAGEHDWICNPSQSKLLAKHIPHSTLKILKHCGHSIAVDAHQQYIKIIKNFLKKKK